MDGGVVKFHTLADADGAGTQNDDLLLVGQHRGIFTVVGGVEIRNIRARMAGIHHFEHREQVVGLAEIVYIQLRAVPQLGNILIAEAHLLGLG